MLSHNETIELIKKAKDGDNNALELLTEDNSPLVKSIVKRYLGKNVEYDDLFQLGSMGLVKAIKNFDVSFDVRFSTYAVPMISGEIKRFLRDDGSIKVSRSVKAFSIEIKSFIDEYKGKHDKAPALNVIAENFNVAVEDVVFALDASHMPVSLYKPIGGGSGGEKSQLVMDKIHDGDETDKILTMMSLKNLLKELPIREQKIIMLRFYRGKTQSEVAEILNVS